MSVQYQAIGWNRQKRLYDTVVVGGVAAYLALFIGIGALHHPNATAETLVIRASGTLALILMHIILCIGPLCRLNRSFLPLLYNRRHLGVTMFLVSLIHGAFSIVQFHSFGNVPPLVSLLTSNTRFGSLADFPFEVFGVAALLILFLMAATSHDFWLHTLSPRTWKRLHMLVYVAWAMLVCHVSLGALQTGQNETIAVLVGVGMATVIGLHLAAGIRETRIDIATTRAGTDGFIEVGEIHAIPEKRARVISAKGERIAVFRYDGKISAISNVCRHQNGPLGEGRIVDGCVTCPWHGYQYSPDSGVSPPPFNDKVATFETKVIGNKVFVHPCPHPPGTRLEPARTEPVLTKPSPAGAVS